MTGTESCSERVFQGKSLEKLTVYFIYIYIYIYIVRYTHTQFKCVYILQTKIVTHDKEDNPFHQSGRTKAAGD